MNIKRILKLLSVLVLSIILFTGCNNSSNENVLKVGMEAGYAPFNWTQIDNSNGAVQIDESQEYAGGYDVEFAKRIAQELGKELIIVKTEWDGLVPALQSGKIDLIIAGMSPTEKRKEKIDFSESYYKSDLVMIIKNDSKYTDAKSIQDFSGAKITGQLNTFHYDVIDQINGVNKVTAMDNFPAMRVALESGVIDGYVTEKPEAISATQANDKFAYIEFEDGFVASPDDTTIAIGAKKGSKLIEEINSILSKISENERLQIMNECIQNQPSSN